MNGENLARRCAEERLELNRAGLQYKRLAEGWRKLSRKFREAESPALAAECEAMAVLEDGEVQRLEAEKEALNSFETSRAMELAAIGEVDGNSNEQ